MPVNVAAGPAAREARTGRAVAALAHALTNPRHASADARERPGDVTDRRHQDCPPLEELELDDVLALGVQYANDVID